MDKVVEMRNIHKYFSSTDVVANNQVDFSVEKGEVHALVGENGAGKTTLMNILYGLVRADQGEIWIKGEEVAIENPDDAIALGIGMVHQHFMLIPSFTVAENVMLGIEPTQAGVLKRKQEVEATADLAERFGLKVDPTARVEELPVGVRQRVEILKVLQREAEILILDEPTAVLTPQEVDELFKVVRNLAQGGRTVIFITHKLPEVMAVADRVSVMRRGEMVGTVDIGETDIPDLAHMMVGREVIFRIEKDPVQVGEKVLEVKNLYVAGAGGVPAVQNVSFDVRRGEILGIAGVSGNGQSELVEAITGMRSIAGGSVYLKGKDITHSKVAKRRATGIAHIPEDRTVVGLNTQATVDENLIVSRYRRPSFSNLGFLRWKSIHEFTKKVIDDFSIAAAETGRGISTLSGGNLQKVVVGRELSGSPDVIVANQPTRGLDVGSIEFVHRTLLDARDQGVGILLVSVELEEILSLSDRIAVLFNGQIAGKMDAQEATEDKLGILMLGGTLEGE